MLTYSTENVFAGRRDWNVISEVKRLIKNSVVHDGRVSTVERWQPVKHFVEDGTKTPPVDRSTIGLFADDFRCQVLWRAAKRGRCLVAIYQPFFAKSEICQDQMAFTVQQNVFRFQVAVNHTGRM